MSELRKFDEPVELRRLRKLQILIETDMWFNRNVELDMDSWKDESNCGTAACLCGMYTIAYPDEGLEVAEWEYNVANQNYYRQFLRYEQYYDFSAAQHFFGIDDDQANELFDGHEYGSDEGDVDPEDIKAEALKRVERIIKEKVACLS